MNKTAKVVHIQYYALLREERGCSEEDIETGAETLLELYEELRSRYNFRLASHMLRVAVNGEFRSWDTPLGDNDKIVFIPPVAGG